ncbi:ABC transporter permease [Bacteroides sp. GD17]|jgi:putative ABC transport system permease protein|uniref:ABC transporter permease n=1 Tax=Bacteroides sp. GD17 TaxID=3139826 RepID=UPI0025EFB599|nr:ABC transporter permease [uncultured Bacteroides sp.]
MRHIYYAFQTLLRGHGSNIIKILSLAFGLLMSVFLFARIAFELNFDNFYHESDKLYLVMTGWMEDGVLRGGYGDYTVHSIPGAVAEEFPDEVQSATTCFTFGGKRLKLGNRKFEVPMVMADTLYFATLGLPVLEGDPQELANPDVIFLSKSVARRIFGSENPIGQTLNYGGEEIPMLVKGIYADVPLNTVLNPHPDAIVSFSSIERHNWARLGWNSGGNFQGYLRLRSRQDAEALNERMTAAVARHIPGDSKLELAVRIFPVKDIHLRSPQVKKMIGIMFFLGIVLLFTTALNYVLVSVSSLTQRAKAIGVHKCSGASGRSIFSMFMVETAAVIVLALLVIGFMVYVFHDKMEELAAIPLATLFDWQNLWAPLAVVAVLFLLGGCLPGMLFSRIPVTQVFRRYTSGRRGWKRVLLFVQFIGAAFILGMMLVVCAQYQYVTKRDRGFRPERVASLFQRMENPDQLRSVVGNLPYVEAVASAGGTMTGFRAQYILTDNQGNKLFSPRNSTFDKDFLSFIGLKLEAGNNLTGEGQLLVNRPFVEQMKWTGSGVGEQVKDHGTVVGVLSTFAFATGPDDREPVMIEWEGGTASNLHVRLKEPMDDNLARLNEEMKKLYPQEENLIFISLEAEMRSFAESVRVFRDVTLLASITILFIILMGLVGYVNDEVRLRSKEIAIRKVNGAEVGSVLRLLSRDVLWLAVPAVALGTFGATRGGESWVSQFSDARPMPVMGYVAMGVFLLLFILACVVMKAWRIANENPVKSIKNE